MAPPLAFTIVVAVLSYLLWHYLRPRVVKSGLSDLRGPAKQSWWSGNFYQIFNRHGWDFHLGLARTYGSAVKVHGLYGAEQLFVFDPLALHHIFVKEQYTFEETDMFIETNKLVFGDGEHHKKQRKMLNPVFSMKHMRDLLPIFYPIAHQLRDVLTEQVKCGKQDINVLMWISRAALEYIGQGGLGYSFEALDETKTNNYSEVVKLFFPTALSLSHVRHFVPYLVRLGPAKFRRKLLEWAPSRRLNRLREIVDTMDVTSREILDRKKDLLAKGDEGVVGQVGKGKDIMSVLLRANLAADENDKLPESEILGQMSSFILAGHETTASAITRIFHQLALNLDVQDRLRAEVTAARRQYGDMDYDTLMGLPFLDAVCRETLRVYPPAPTIMRVTRKDVVLPLLWPVRTKDGREVTTIPLQKNTRVYSSVINANRSTAIWGPDADEWKPERWVSPLPDSVSKAHLPGVYASMMTFIGGHRACIGFKFAELEMKLVLSILVETFVFSPGSEEIYWSFGNVHSPTVKGSTDISPRLPLNVSFVHSRF